MSTSELREELHDFIDKADERLLNLIYAMVQADMTEDNYQLSDEHKKILDERMESHSANPTSGSTWEEVKARIKMKL